jgi:hypothetical protein
MKHVLALVAAIAIGSVSALAEEQAKVFDVKTDDVKSVAFDLSAKDSVNVTIALHLEPAYQFMKFTERHIGKKATLTFNGTPLWENVEVREAIRGGTFNMSVMTLADALETIADLFPKSSDDKREQNKRIHSTK